ncbi:MAG: indolepyruvate ferredoxin oxidoreductase family protein [Dermatophilaceae bacterium]
MSQQVAVTTLRERYTAQQGRVHLTGIQALVRLAMDLRRADDRAGRRTAAFICGYEGSPLGGFDLELQRNQALLDELDILLQPGLNEELAATAVQGTQLACTQPDKRVEGVMGLWYGKSPGVDRSLDALRHNNLMGTHPDGGVLLLAGDDPSAKSSTAPGASENVLADVGMPVLYPADPQDVLDLGWHGMAMSRACGLWVALKIVTNVADGSGSVDLDRARPACVMPDTTIEGHPYRHTPTAHVLQPTVGELERSRDGARRTLALRYAVANGLNRITRRGDHDRIGIVAAGASYLTVRQALRHIGLDDAALERLGVRLLHLRMIWPLEPAIVREFARDLREVVVVEEKRPLVELGVKDALYGSADPPAVYGKQGPDGALFAQTGELDPDRVARALAQRIVAVTDDPGVQRWLDAVSAGPSSPTLLPMVSRLPFFCSGCPHNTSTFTPDGVRVGAGIGCHAMVALMNPNRVGDVVGLTQMGGEGAQWIGMQPFLRDQHFLQNLGDGTFHHSGSLAVRAAVAAGVNITYRLLYNSVVAMTGGQRAVGAMPVDALARGLAAEGVRRIIITTENPAAYEHLALPDNASVWHRERTEQAREALAAVPGVTVLVHDQECAAELRRKRKRRLADTPVERVVINERVCEGCGDCGRKSNCLSVQPVDTEFGRKTRIDQSSCNLDYSCLAGDCPSFLTVIPRGATARSDPPALDPAFQPDPSGPDVASHTTRITGIGGTGVVTLAQVLAMAATLAGRHVRALDQTGLAQKGGAVVSDLTITTEPVEAANKAIAGECDLYLGCDLLVAADGRNLRGADPTRTVCVLSTSKVPTGQMIGDVDAAFPDVDEVVGLIAGRSREVATIDARAVAQTLFGDDQYANLLLAGMAYQCGALPLPADAVEEAIRLNGVGAEANIAAFRAGRVHVADPDAFRAMLDQRGAGSPARPAPSRAARSVIATVGATQGSELERLVEIRVPDLVDYQDLRYATRYAGLVARVRRAEASAVPGSSRLAETVARYLYQLMAYKDEYEVARLALDPAVTAAIRAQFGQASQVSYQLHPPLLRALGREHKIRLGPWFTPALRALAAMRRVRGTALDPFGATAIRRMERELVTEYEGMLEGVLRDLGPDTIDLAVRIAALPDLVRGYEQVKVDSVARYRAEYAGLKARTPTPVDSPA